MARPAVLLSSLSGTGETDRPLNAQPSIPKIELLHPEPVMSFVALGFVDGGFKGGFWGFEL